ncbi:MAG TPA: hypothetical protein VFZ21_30820 [Gemmatimonadaceae bacterium]|nr:hypothetical protein [Gemmatimonadaceae bacterium]
MRDELRIINALSAHVDEFERAAAHYEMRGLAKPEARMRKEAVATRELRDRLLNAPRETGEVMRDKDERVRAGDYKRLDWEVTCPFCGASPGQSCGRDRGPEDPSHRERIHYMADKSRGESDLRAAKERLGAWWLADYSERSVNHIQLSGGSHGIYLYTDRLRGADCYEVRETEAAAILAALEKVNA